MRKLAGLAPAAALALLAGCGGGEGNNSATASAGGGGKQATALATVPKAGSQTLAQLVGGNADLSGFTGAVRKAGLEQVLAGGTPYTLLVPDNAAIAKVPEFQGFMASGGQGQLTGVVTYHMLPGVITVADIRRAVEKGGGKAQLATLGGGTLTATATGNAILLTDARGGETRIVGAEQAAANGVLHRLDALLMPGPA